MRQAVGPVGQLLVGALAAIADQRDAIAKTLFDDAVSQFDRGVEIVRILKLRAVEQQRRPLLQRRQASPRKIVDMARRAEILAGSLTLHSLLPSLSAMKGSRSISRTPGNAVLGNHFRLKVIFGKGGFALFLLSGPARRWRGTWPLPGRMVRDARFAGSSP
jgi:hypothetical protein